MIFRNSYIMGQFQIETLPPFDNDFHNGTKAVAQWGKRTA